ncbi:hypothetical protein HOY80DRAFT_928662 [Tuber brumale]|nr:hypothetical protein HOY80DRAFT_928662 [Tuber brumale]
MEVFTDVPSRNFRTGLPPFRRPTGTKTDWELCIAVTSKEGQVLTALYSILVTLLFIVCWKLISTVVLALSSFDGISRRDAPSGDTSRYKILRGLAIVGFWNSREPLEATCFTGGFLTLLLQQKQGIPGVRSSTLGLLILAILWLLGTYAASIMVAGTLIAGKVAPAHPSGVYIPETAGTASADIMRLQALRAPAALRSLGSAEAASRDHSMRKRLSLEYHISSGASSKYFTYDYTVTSHDMGLQKWYDLKQEVKGRCDVDSGWFSKYVPQEDLDVYRPWGLANKTVNVVHNGERKTAPSATAIPFPYAQKDFFVNQAVEHRYGIIAHTSHRASHRVGTDPWYETELFTPQENETDAQIIEQAGNRVKGGRPALSCTQKDIWSYKGTQFKNIYELTDEANIKFPPGWVKQLQFDFMGPRVIDVINSAGSSSLASSTTFVGGLFDAQSSSIQNDMDRLFTATWISSAHTFRNMLMVSGEQSFDNAALDKTKQPQDGVDLFVVSTPQVATLRFSVLIAIPVLLISFSFVLGVMKLCGGGGWYEKTRFAEGAYQFLSAKKPGEFTDPRTWLKDAINGTPDPSLGGRSLEMSSGLSQTGRTCAAVTEP